MSAPRKDGCSVNALKALPPMGCRGRKIPRRGRKRIRELEKSLEFSRLETQARDLMIDKAEEYFDIPIRKKSGAK